MKKFLIFVAALAFLSCSSNEEISDVEQSAGKLVKAKIGVDMGNTQATRAYLGAVTTDKEGGVPTGTYTITHQFEYNDKMYITDYLGQHEFQAVQGGQTGQFEGEWAKIDNDAVKNGILATFPASAVTAKVKVNGGKPTMYFNLSTNQTSYVYRDDDDSAPQLSYDRNAGLAFACADNKQYNLWFLPVVSYLYFYSAQESCKIFSTEFIAGDYEVTYSGTAGTGTNAGTGSDYSTAEGLSQFLTYKANKKEITCHGLYVPGHKNKFDNQAVNYYEYIIAVKPGYYAENSLWIKANNATKSLYCPEMTLIPSQLYFIGSIDAPNP